MGRNEIKSLFWLACVPMLSVIFPQTSGAVSGKLEPGIPWAFFHDVHFTRSGGWGTDTRIDLDTGSSINDYSKRWIGFIQAPVRGRVTFQADADNGVRLWIAHELIVDGWRDGETAKGSFVFDREGVWLPIKVEFFQLGGKAHLRLAWSWEGHSSDVIPSSAFGHTLEQQERIKEMAGAVERVSAEEVAINETPIYVPGAGCAKDGQEVLNAGPYLFLDDFLIAESEGITRRIQKPVRDLSRPVVTGKEDGCFQPYMTVLRDERTQRFRIWYGHRVEDRNAGRSHVATMESEDGIHWNRPARVLKDPDTIQFGVSVLDEGGAFSNPLHRYKFGWYMDGGLKVASSPDGLHWKPIVDHVVFYHNHDINSIGWDPLRGRYFATISVYREGPAWTGKRRITMQSYSEGLLHWESPHYVITPNDSIEPGETQFYAMEGYLARGDLLIGMVKVLRDDLKVDDPPDPPEAYGMGYTALSWSRDGLTWVRDLEHFFDPDPEKGKWDHAHAWIEEQVLVEEQVYLYYGGYARGHKVNRFEERQIGLVRMKRDRYVARTAESGEGWLRTPLVTLEGNGLSVNVDASKPGASLRVQLLDEAGRPVKGFGLEECKAITGDHLDAPVEWQAPLAQLKERPVRIEFVLKQCSLYGCTVRGL